jgi:hypothetical protein
MASAQPPMISVPLTVVLLPSHRPVAAAAPCLRCGAALELHQPDGDAPQRLLGTCDACGGWHLIDCDGSVVVLLPQAAALRDAEAIGSPSKSRRRSP